MLLEKDAELDQQVHNRNNTALHVGYLEVVKLLYANTNAATIQIADAPFLQVATERDHCEILWFLVRQLPWLVAVV